MKWTMGVLIFVAGALWAQQLTPRQLFYKDDPPPAKPADATKPPAKKKAAPPKQVKSDPKPAAQGELKPVVGEIKVMEPRPIESHSSSSSPAISVVNAAYSDTKAPAAKSLGLRYSLVQVSNGGETEVSPSATFRSGDMVRVKVEGNRDGYLYVIARGSSGNWKPLFPSPEINGGNNRVTAHSGYSLPSNTQAFTFDETAGQEQLFIIYSMEPVTDMEGMIPTLSTPEAPRTIVAGGNMPITDGFVSQMRTVYARDLLVQTVDPKQPAAAAADDGKPENAVYVVSKTGGRLVADIRLEHR